jgi:NAD(P)-dependent dehydrogenase (short-subunit alcohol dehydrogenase family)
LDDAVCVTCDVTAEADRVHLVEETTRRFGRIDGLVNNAGSAHITPALAESSDAFREMLELNLVGPFAIAREAVRVMRQNGGGAIVNVSTTHAVRPLAVAPCAGYTAAKAGLAGLTRELALQWARYDVRVNAIAPGAFATANTGAGLDPGRIADWMLERIPLGRFGRPADLDSMLLTLLHPSASYVTGQLFVVDGGLTIG